MTTTGTSRGARTVHDTTPPSMDAFGEAIALAHVLDFVAPVSAPDGAMHMEAVTYGTAGRGGRDLTLWVHRRRDPTERRPGVVFVHGGGWAGGSPAYHLRHAHQLAAQGFVAANITYRLSPEAPWPACIEDVKCAIRWMRASADELGLDPHRIAVIGGSAGGHLAVMAALTADRPELEGTGGHGEQSSAVQAAAVWYPAIDLRSFLPTEARAMIDALLPDATEAEILAASPLGVVHAGAPPLLTMTGDADAVTTLADIDAFHAAVTDLGVRNELVVFPGRDHGFDFHPADWAACFDRLSNFLAEVLAPEAERALASTS